MTGTPLLQVTKPAETGDGGLTLSALMHDEMFFLPAFLDHYRALGVTHFALLDDASTDGSRDYAAAQPDVTLLESPHRYGDMLPGPDGRQEKAKMLWRRELLARWGSDRWTLHLDLDEFVDLPDGLDLPALSERLEAGGHDTAYGAMVDLYPEKLNDLNEMEGDLRSLLDWPWFFDAVPHVVPQPFGPPVEVYGGTRGRLTLQYALPHKPIPIGRRLTGLIWGNTAPYLHRLRKAVLLKWSPKRTMRNEHTIRPARTARMILPIRHYKFTPALSAKIDFALASGAYAKNSGQYKVFDDLLDVISEQGGSFLGEMSRPYTGFEGFKAAGIARGF
ncbi:glycosyltransferase family 2 protein [Tropicimonas aquimaris]|uniref:Glycosyltransferase family 2 protein n=1 Tax=Tropicimonas aquimaris TaxID=914152 RepID=A0ABW3IPF7_9RHOB